MFIVLFQSAMSKLIRGGEWELAIITGKTLGNVQNHVSEAAKCLARKCEKENLRFEISALRSFFKGLLLRIWNQSIGD